MRRFAVVVLAPTLGEHVFLLRLQHREPLDFLKIAGEPGLAGDDRKGSGHDILQSETGLAGRLRRRCGQTTILVQKAWPKKGPAPQTYTKA